MKRAIALLTIVFIFGGCNDFLKKEPLGEVSEETAYTSASDAQKALTAAYHANLQFSRLYYYGIFEQASDNARKGGEGPSDGAGMRRFEYFNLTSTNSVAKDIWQNCYLGINRANRVIKNVPNIKMGGDQKQRIIAEAKFLRGYFYFLIVTLYGDVPLITKPEVKSTEVERTSKDQVLKLIYQDFMDASDVLPLKSQLTSDELGRATKGAAQAYLGKVYLYQHDFSKAETWFKKVIDSNEYYLNPDFAQIFDIDGEFGPGHIFEINHIYSSQYPFLSNHGTITRGSAGMYGYGFLCPTQDLVDSFEPNDPRLSQTVFTNGDTLSDGKMGDVGNSETPYMSRKPYISEDEFPPTGDVKDSGKNEILLRYGQLLLWYAEVANENGHIQEALKALNKVRERARQGNSNVLPDVTITDKDKLRKKIWHEERVEYATENERYLDLVRQGRAGKVMKAFANKYNTNKGANFRDGVNELLPIPQSEIDLSQGKLKQNPGYE